MAVKTINDYVDRIHENYPFLKRKEVYRIVKFFFFQMWQLNYRGADVSIRTLKHQQFFHMGKLTFDPIARRDYWIMKMQRKLRILYRQKVSKWDGYYYFALHDKEFARIIAQDKKRGRPKKNFTFRNLKLYKIFEECLLMEQNKKNIFRIPFVVEIGTTSFKHEYTTSEFEYIFRIVEGGLKPITDMKECHNNLLKENGSFLYWKTVEE